jgi:hypothetical protein
MFSWNRAEKEDFDHKQDSFETAPVFLQWNKGGSGSTEKKQSDQGWPDVHVSAFQMLIPYID